MEDTDPIRIVVGCAGFRRLESLFAGPCLYVDDLVTCEGLTIRSFHFKQEV